MSGTIFHYQGWRVAHDGSIQPTGDPAPVLLQVTAPRDGAFTFTQTNLTTPALPEGAYEFDFGGAEWRLDGELITEDHLARTFEDEGFSGRNLAWHLWSLGQVLVFLRPGRYEDCFPGEPAAPETPMRWPGTSPMPAPCRPGMCPFHRGLPIRSSHGRTMLTRSTRLATRSPMTASTA